MRKRTWLKAALAIVVLLLTVVGAGLVADMTDLAPHSDGAGSTADSLRGRLARVADRSVVRLTHYGRKTGTPYEVTTWFAVDGDTVYLPTTDRGRQWARNVRHTPRVTLQIGPETFAGTVTPLTDDAEKHRVNDLLRKKYWTIWAVNHVAVLMGRDPDNEELDLGRGGFYRVVIGGLVDARTA
jgi:deazaflavin-dependent oxidoreductase (nitroreductase family)